jgi:hypothetical protein
MTISKVLSAGLFAAAMLASPVMAQQYHHVSRTADVSMQRGPEYRRDFGTADARDCVRAPNVGAYASDPYTIPPCEPGYFN